MPRFTRFNIFSLLFLIPVLFLLNSCATGGGYSNRAKPWDYKPPQQQAQQAPNPLSESPGDNSQNKSAERNILNNPGIESEPLDAGNMGGAMAGTHTQPAAAQSNLPAIKVALLLPLSGQHKRLGQSMLKAAQMALFDIGYDSFELLPKDTKGTPDGAQSAAQSALDDGAQFILGPVFSQSVRAAKNVTRRAGINMIAFSTDWTQAGGNAYMMGFLPFDQIERVVSYAQSQGIQRVGVLAPTTDYGNAVMNAYRSATASMGINTVDTVQFAAGDSGLSTTVRNFARYDARNAAAQSAAQSGAPTIPPPFDAVLMPVGGEMARSMASMLSQYDLGPSNVKRLGTGLWDDAGLASEPSLDGGWFAAPSPRARASFEDRYNMLYKTPAPRLASLAYDATALAAILGRHDLQQQGRPAFDHSAITNPNGFAGIDGIFRFRSDGIVERGLAVLEFRKGRVVVIDDAPRTFQQQPGQEQYSRY
ncbi:MAG: penicillin-binding protein activator [Micavibrio sp.]|nr:MAG: penicillin-binding protein activator [Micavibrio sp.]